MSRKYDNSLRKQRAWLRSLRDTLRDIKRREGKGPRKTHVKREQGRPLKERRAARREKMLPKDRVCPVCRNVFIKSRQWVVRNGIASCITCDRQTKQENE